MVTRFLKSLYQARLEEGQVIKNLGELRGLKWLPARLMLFCLYPYALSTVERTAREITFMISWHQSPKIIAWGPGIVVREYIEGEVLSPKDSEDIATVLLELHNNCWRLGDTKYDNFIKDKKGVIRVIDAEQSIKSCDEKSKVVDLVIAMFFICLSTWPRYSDALKLYKLYSSRSKVNKVYLFHPGLLALFLICPWLLFKILKE